MKSSNISDLRRAQEVAKMGSWYLDLEKNELRWSGETYRIFGLSSKKTITYEVFLELVHPDDRQIFVDAKWRGALKKEPYDVEHRILVGGKVKWVREKAEFECDKKGRPLCGIGIVQDITEQKQSELERRQLQDELAYVSRHALMGEFSSALVHELNQPLAATLSNAQAARRYLSAQNINTNEVRAIIEDIIKDTNRAGDIIRKLRVLLNKAELKLQPLDICGIISEVIAIVKEDLIMRDIKLDFNSCASVAPVLADRTQIQQVMVNLIRNACEAMDSVDKKEIFIRAQENEKYVLVTVRDLGNGFFDKDTDRFFAPFYTTKSAGMGMGLSISKRIIESHQGRIWAKNHPEGGAVLSIELRKA